MLQAGLFFTFPILVILAAVSDLLTMKIPNVIPILLAISFSGAAVFVGLSLHAWGWHLLAGGVVLVASFTMFALGWMGGGDAKIASAIALWLGFNQDLVTFLIFTAVFGMVLTVLLLFLKKLPFLPMVLARQEWIARLHDPKTGIPYGIAIAGGALVSYPETLWFTLLG